MSKSPCKYHYLRSWLTGEGYGEGFEPRPVVLECIRSRSGMSMQVYDRGERIFTVNGCGFDRIGTALGRFLEELFQPELKAASISQLYGARYGLYHDGTINWSRVMLEGACGVESMIEIAKAIGLKVHQSETKAGTLLIIEKGK